MPARVNRRVGPAKTLIAAMAIVIGGADGAFGDPSEGDTGSEESRWSDWIPAVGLTGTFTAQNQDSAVSSSCDHGGPGSAILAPCTQGIVEPGVDPRTGPPTFFADPSPLRDPADGSGPVTTWSASRRTRSASGLSGEQRIYF